LRWINVTQSYRRFTSRELSLILILSSLGGAVSVPIGYAGNLLKTVPGIPIGSSQLLSGLHVLWLVLAAALVRKTWSGTMTGVLKGLVEAFLFSYHGVFVFIMSALEGLMVDLAFAVFGRKKPSSIYLVGGLSSASNVSVTQFIIAPQLPLFVFAFMYLASFISGLFFAGYLGKHVLDIISSSSLLSTEPGKRPEIDEDRDP